MVVVSLIGPLWAERQPSTELAFYWINRGLGSLIAWYLQKLILGV